MATPMWMVTLYEAKANQTESCVVMRMQDDYSGAEEVQHYHNAFVYDRVMVHAATMVGALLLAVEMVRRAVPAVTEEAPEYLRPPDSGSTITRADLEPDFGPTPEEGRGPDYGAVSSQERHEALWAEKRRLS